MSLVRRFEPNLTGRDFVVGDIHGCFDALQRLLDGVGFRYASDRLFSVGDLVDRGPDSERAEHWLRQPWFHPVMGNHEEMACMFFAGQCSIGHYAANGGHWFIGLPRERQAAFAASFAGLPVAIEVSTARGERIGIVHAEPHGASWPQFASVLRGETDRERDRALMSALWGRTRFNDKDNNPVAGVERVFVGHTPVQGPVVLGNVVYTDLGCVFGRRLGLFDLGGSLVATTDF